MTLAIRLPVGLFFLLIAAAPVGADQANRVEFGDQVRVIFSDDKVKADITVTDAAVRQRGRLVQAFVKIANQGKKETQVEYLVDWEDDQGFPIESTKAVWEPLFLAGRQEESVNFIGKHRNAYRLILTLRSKD